MQVHHGLESFEKLPPSVVTNGTFDGVHYGHQKILKRLTEIAAKNNLQTVVITFWPHPRFVLGKDAESLRLLSTLEEKVEYLRAFHIDHLVVIRFDRNFSELTSQEFIYQILIEKINTKVLVIGYDHRFGKNREGSFEYLKSNETELGFTVEEIPKQELEEVAISSSKIRKALLDGRVDIAQRYLGRPHQINGLVVKGDQIGRQLGFPTANIQVDNTVKLIPKDGIYAVRVLHKGTWYDGMMNIGFRPTIAGNLQKTTEVNIFSFSQTIYGEKVSIFFHKYLRSEQKFDDLQALKNQLAEDKATAQLALKA